MEGCASAPPPASSPGILLYPAAACRVTQRFFKTKVTAPPTVPTKRAEELTGDEATPPLYTLMLPNALSAIWLIKFGVCLRCRDISTEISRIRGKHGKLQWGGQNKKSISSYSGSFVPWHCFRVPLLLSHKFVMKSFVDSLLCYIYGIYCRIATQGRWDADNWVTKYSLLFSYNGVIFQYYKQGGRTKVCAFNPLRSKHAV